MQAVRVGRIPVPLPSSQTRCPRCGVVFDHWRQSVVPGSPCGDCRPILRADGDTTVWRRPSANRKPKP